MMVIIGPTSKDVLRIKWVIICKGFRTMPDKQEEYMYMSVKYIHKIGGKNNFSPNPWDYRLLFPIEVSRKILPA